MSDYSSYYGYYNCTPCYTNSVCSTSNGCQPACQLSYPPACQPIICYQQPSCLSPPPEVYYITYVATSTSVISGGTDIPIGTTIAAGSTTVPTGTVTVINGYTGSPTKTSGGVTANNGFFTVPCTGRYAISTMVSFASVDTTTSSDLRQVYIYKVSVTDNVVSCIGSQNELPIASSNTVINVSTEDVLTAGDRIFIAVRQINSSGVAISTVAGVGRLAIIKM